ncbi:MAG: hypothetical protein AB7O66_08730, partial [Limisphaerales bacterium]
HEGSMIRSGLGNPLQVNPDQGLASASPFVLFVRFVVSYAGFWGSTTGLASSKRARLSSADPRAFNLRKRGFLLGTRL